MSIAIGSSTSAQHIAAISPQPAPTASPNVDTDGDHDGSKAGEIERPKAISGSVGTIIDTKA